MSQVTLRALQSIQQHNLLSSDPQFVWGRKNTPLKNKRSREQNGRSWYVSVFSYTETTSCQSAKWGEGFDASERTPQGLNHTAILQNMPLPAGPPGQNGIICCQWKQLFMTHIYVHHQVATSSVWSNYRISEGGSKIRATEFTKQTKYCSLGSLSTFLTEQIND